MLFRSLAEASEQMKSSQKNYIDLFYESYKKLDPGARLSAIFSTFELKSRITPQSTDEEVLKVLRGEVNSAVENSFNVLRTRIDRFGVVQPNIQRMEGTGRILIELPGVKEPERVRKLLQGSANLEFWETYEFSQLYESIVLANNIVRDMQNVGVTEENAAIDSLEETEETIEAETSVEDDLLAKLGETDSTDEAASFEEWKKEYQIGRAHV